MITTFKNRTFGIRMDGLQRPMEELIENHQNITTSDYYCVCEIGCAAADTTKSLYDIVSEKRNGRPFNVFSFDVPSCAINNINGLIKNFNGKPNIIRKEEIEGDFAIKQKEMYLFLLENPQEFIKHSNLLADFVFIDGIHSEHYVTEDFLAIENKVKPGGYVVFHDFCEASQGTDPQIGGGFIEVRQAVKKLGLLNNNRQGWEFVKEIFGSRTTLTGTKDGNGIGIFRKL